MMMKMNIIVLMVMMMIYGGYDDYDDESQAISEERRGLKTKQTVVLAI